MKAKIKPATMRENQAYNDGRIAFRNGLDYHNNPRRSVQGRAAWAEGFEHESKIATAEKITPDERTEAVSVAGRLKDWVKQQREAQA